MKDVLEQLTRALPILPTVLVILLAAVAGRLAKRLLRGDPGAASSGEFRTQIAQMTIGLSSVLLVMVVLPVPPELRGQLLSLFGIVLSAAIALASTTFVGNVMAGIMLKAVRNFRTGDFVRVGDQFGRVTERGLLSTEIQTEDRDLVTLPNLHLVTNPVKVIRASGTIISAEISLGYDVPHGQVEALLAAAATDAGLDDPFVLLLSLGDFSVTYRISGLLGEVKQLLTVRSRLRVAMLDQMHGAGVEIVSPSFMNQRVLSPEARVLPVGAMSRPVADSGPTIETIAFDKADDAESLDELVATHKQTREAIAELADAPATADPEQTRRRQDQLTRRLASLEAAIADKQEAAKVEDADHS